MTPTFGTMRTGWKRFGAFVVVVVALVALVELATRNEPRSASLLAIEIGFIAAMAYLVTFLVWPRRVPQVHGRRPGVAVRTRAPRPDARPVVVIGDRPAGSKPGSSLHLRDTPTTRAVRGRRPGPRPQAEIRWPAKR